ncbi:glycosyltransferase family 2 protein [Fusobacterium varium]|nr:glycosyltransferase family 2 protein [Fusobacterium varium]
MGNKIFQEDLVSVIIPVYNSEKFIKETLNSVLNQTYKNIEIVLIDDCSKDNSENIIKQYQNNNKNIIYFKQAKNLGAGHARNKALELAKGRYVAFLDSDDIWFLEKIDKQLALMRKTNTSFCYTAIEMIDEDSNTVKPKRSIKEECTYKYLLQNTIIATSSVIVDRRQIGDFRMHLRRGGQDYATWLKLLGTGIIAKGLNETLVRYRVSKGSLSSNKFKSIQQVWEIQTQEENINKIVAGWNILCFCINALKKYYI